MEQYNVITETLARAGYEVNRVFCQAMGDHSHPRWEEADEGAIRSSRMQAAYALQGGSPSSAHELWRIERQAAGWSFGPERDPVKKTHPALMPWADLPPEQRAKNNLFYGVVREMMSAFWRIPQQ